jgi:phosphoribosylaminoimidazole carboxylase (NCAIR synthetase)
VAQVRAHRGETSRDRRGRTPVGAHLQLYGKAPRAGRKVGHVTLVAPDEDVVARLLALADEASQG